MSAPPPPPRRIIGYQPTKAPPPKPPPNLVKPPTAQEPKNLGKRQPTMPFTQPQKTASRVDGSSKIQPSKTKIIPGQEQGKEASQTSGLLSKKDKLNTNEEQSKSKAPSEQKGALEEDIESDDGSSSASDEAIEDKQPAEKVSEESSGISVNDDELMGMDFDPVAPRINDGVFNRILSVRDDVGIDEQRHLKKLIKKYWENRKVKVQSIDRLRINVDNYYPTIRLLYRCNGKEEDMNVLQMYKTVREKDESAKLVIRQLFGSQFTMLHRDACKKMFGVLAYRVKYLLKDFKAELNDRDKMGISNVLSAVYSIVPNKTLQFSFVDSDFNQLSFNNFFLEKYKQRLSDAYKFYTKAFQPRLTNVSNPVFEEQFNGQVNRPHVGDEQLSSDDDQPIRRMFRPVTFEEVKQKLMHLFAQQLTRYSKSITEKEEEFESMRIDEKDQNVDKQAILSEQIGEMFEALDIYKTSRENARESFNQIIAKKIEEREKAEHLDMIHKQLRMLRVQLDSKLPILSKKRELFRLLDKCNLVVLEGETGSGKSTQLPQMLCEYYKVFTHDRVKPIVLTQPRKIATRTLAERIAFEMGEEVHRFVDYVASSGNSPNPSSKIIVKLDRLLLDEFENDPLLSNYSCLVIDEAHERTISIDVIIGLIANVLRQRKDFKVIVTSATLDAALFEKYFKAKTFKVSGRLYPVEIIYKPYSQQESMENKVFKCIIEEILEDRSTIRNKYKGHVLTFCTGVDEINKLCDRMRNYLNLAHFIVVGLHGKLTAEEQRLAFSDTPNQCKFIFASRIAETAITIDNVKVVIDPGQDRENVYDQKKKISSFQMKPISRSAAKQRAGRAGRTSAGYCFRLYDLTFEKDSMPANKTPEIESVPLDIIVLRLKALKIENLLDFPYLSKPKEDSISASVESMQLIGCLDYRQEITPIGRNIVRIPIEPLLSRAIIDAILLEKLDRSRKVLSRVIKVLAIIANSQSIFYSNEDTREICETAKFNEFAEESGDFFSLLNVYTAFEHALSMGKDRAACFIRERFLNKKSLFQCRELVREINAIVELIQVNNLKDFGGYVDDLKQRLKKYPSDNELILSCLLTSFCQNLCLYSGDSQVGYTLFASKQPLQVYGSSFIALQGLTPRWIVCYDIIKTSATFCRIAQEVDFEMLKSCVSQQMFEKYQLAECEKFNPFYVSLERLVPTVVMKHLQQKQWEGDQNMPWLYDNSLVFDRDRNKVRLFVLQENSRYLRQFEDYLKYCTNWFLEKDYVHNYLGSITAHMEAGCRVKQLYLSTNFFSVKLSNLTQQYQEKLSCCYSMFWHDYEQVKKNEVLITFREEEDRKRFISWWKEEFLVENPKAKCRLELAKNYIERRNRVAAGCIKLRFWASEPPQKNRCIMYCDVNPQAIERIKENLLTTEKELNLLMQGINFSITKKENAITAYIGKHTHLTDEFELARQLKNLEAQHPILLPHRNVRGFRAVDTTESLRTEDHWAEQIRKLFKDEVPADHIKVYGSCQDQACRNAIMKQCKEKQTKYRPCSQHFTDIFGIVNIFDSKVAEDFIKKYNGKTGILGTEKFHATIEYRQSIMRIPAQIFTIFRNKYAHQKDQLMLKYPGLELVERDWVNHKGEQYVFIECASQRRDKLITPIATIKKVFTKHSISLGPDEVRAINRYDFARGYSKRVYEGIIENLVLDLNFEIFVDYATMKNEVRVYCLPELFEQVEAKLRGYLKYSDEQSVRISYRGKNIYKVQEIIEEFKGNVEVTISYSEKCVRAVGPSDQVAEFKNRIEGLVNNATAECLICFNILSMPVKLLLCGHTFCNACLCAHVRSVKDDPASYPLSCPQGAGCRKVISIHDLRYLIDYEEFSQCCDRSIQRMVDNVKYHGCYTVNCEQIFDVQRTRSDGNSFHCPTCNIAYCFLCKDDRHEGMTCDRYRKVKKGELTKEDTEKLGIKTCPKCKNGIQKNEGCNHISCTCGAHICWKCLKHFDTGDKCYDHLAKECGGIFPNGADRQ